MQGNRANIDRTGTDGREISAYRSPDGVLSFLLEKTPIGLLVRRERLQRSLQLRLRHTALFSDSDTFGRWLDSDTTRFDYPVVHARVRRQGSAYLESDEDGAVG